MLNCCTVNTRGFIPPMYVIGLRTFCRESWSSSKLDIDDLESVSKILVVEIDSTPMRYHAITARGTGICPGRFVP